MLHVSPIAGIKNRTGQVLCAYHLGFSQSITLGNLNNTMNIRYFRQLILCDNCDKKSTEVYPLPDNFSRNLVKNLPSQLDINFQSIVSWFK